MCDFFFFYAGLWLICASIHTNPAAPISMTKQDAERVYELAKARKLLRIGALLERLSRMGRVHLRYVR